MLRLIRAHARAEMREAGFEPAPISRLDPKSVAPLEVIRASEDTATKTYRQWGGEYRVNRNNYRNNAGPLSRVEHRGRVLAFPLARRIDGRLAAALAETRGLMAALGFDGGAA